MKSRNGDTLSCVAVMSAQVGFHWLTFSTGVKLDDLLKIMGGSFGDTERRGGFGNPFRITHESGAVIYHGAKSKDQPRVVNVPGEVCETWSADGLRWAKESCGWVTRLDVAADLGPDELARRRIREMHRAWVREKVQTKMAPTSHEMHTDAAKDGGWTAVFGAKSASIRMRAYDRRGPLRMEWQWRPEREVGHVVPIIALNNGAAPVWRSLASACVFPMEWYRQLLDGESVEWKSVESEQTTLLRALDQLRAQWGTTIWALEQIGIQLGELARDPVDQATGIMRGEVGVKMLTWAKEAPRLGYDGSKLEQEVRCRLKSKHA